MLKRFAPIALVSCGWFGTPSATVPVPPPIAEPVHVAPAPTDVEPAVRGSPAGSFAARPTWAQRSDYAPASAEYDAELLFAAGVLATEPRQSLDGELLACRVDVKFEEIKSWSLRPHKWKNADLVVVYGFGDGGATGEGRLSTIAKSQRNHSHFVLPAARMKDGDVIDVLLNDADRLFARDFIDRVALGFSGSTPIVATTAVSSIVCRVVPPAELRPFVHERLWNVDDALASWRQSAPEIRSGTSTCAAPQGVKDSIVHLAAVLGWDDPRVAARLEQAASTELAVLQACADRFAKLVAGLDAPGAPATLPGMDIGVRVIESSCDPARVAKTAGSSAKDGCMFALEVTNRAAAPLVIPGGDRIHEAWEIVAYDARGRALATSAPGAARQVAAGAVGRHELVTGHHARTALLGPAEAAPAPAVLIEIRKQAFATEDRLAAASSAVRLRL